MVGTFVFNSYPYFFSFLSFFFLMCVYMYSSLVKLSKCIMVVPGMVFFFLKKKY